LGEGGWFVKCCIKSALEPECLSAFRRNNSLGTWEELRDDNAGRSYKTMRASLTEDQGGICAYCEIDFREENKQIAHFHPKSDLSGAINWALKWSNLWLSCKGGSQTWMKNHDEYLPPLPDNLSCDEFKGNKKLDGIVLAPNDIPAFPRIFRFEQEPDTIKIVPDADQCRAANISVDKVQITINSFNLNCRRLGESRLTLIREIEQQLKRLRERSNDPQRHYQLLVQRFLAKKADGFWHRFFTFVRWRFNRLAEKYLEDTNYQG
jgi:uncharacterized protein (TIGR02646 family)